MTETLCTYYRKKCAIQELVNLQNVYCNQGLKKIEMQFQDRNKDVEEQLRIINPKNT